jgi:hypothetical protein
VPENIVLEGTAEYDAALRKLVELILDLRPFWPLVVPLFVGWMGKQFESEGEFFGEQWRELSEPYATWKMTHYPGKGLLSAEGDLRRAATTPQRIARPESLVLRIRPYQKTTRSTELTASGRTSRARIGTGHTMDPDWFQSGTDRMPARPLLGDVLPPEASAELREAAERYIDENARKLGLLAE